MTTISSNVRQTMSPPERNALLAAFAAETFGIIERLTASTSAFTSDDVWHLLKDARSDIDSRTIANAFIRAERLGLIRNSRIAVYVRGRQAHRRWLAIWLSTRRRATYDDATAYARASIEADRRSTRSCRVDQNN